jgi:uncharacterized membrane protein
MVEQSVSGVLTFAYWLHMAATVLWAGGLATIIFFVNPLAQQNLTGNFYRPFITKIYSRIQQVGWFCLVLLVVTGMFQMSSNPNYEGFLTIDNSWSLAILLKHLVIGLLVLVSAYITWILDPKITRIYLTQRDIEKEINYVELKVLENMKVKLSRVNLVIFLAVLAFTAWARAA